MKIDFYECVKSGVDQVMRECELTIGMTLNEAVEKQIPKKPINIRVAYFGKGKGGNCPNCMVGVNSIEYKYCRCCGQALDWGDTE